MTPECTLCGLACEWLRSSYTSEWALFADDERTTPGQYCFCPEGTPHYSGWHNFGSRNWTQGELGGRGRLGELPTAKRSWHSGMTPEPYPNAVAFGSSGCFANGEPGEIVGWSSIYQGFPNVCYLAPPAVARAVIRPIPDIGNRDTMKSLAGILDRTYSDMAVAGVLAAALVGNPVSVQIWENNDSEFPGMVVAYCDDWTFVAISGTTNELQWALQILYPTLGAVPYANYETSPIWRAAAAYAEERLASVGIDVTKPIMLTGHSYGGVVATLMAADFRQYQPGRRIDLWTMGMPRPASSSIHTLLDTVRQIHLANDDDPVPGLPPHINEFGWLFNAIGIPLGTQWEQFASPRGQRIMDVDGFIVEDGTTTASIVNVLYVIAQVLAFQPIDPGFGHTAEEYLRRLLLPV